MTNIRTGGPEEADSGLDPGLTSIVADLKRRGRVAIIQMGIINLGRMYSIKMRSQTIGHQMGLTEEMEIDKINLKTNNSSLRL